MAMVTWKDLRDHVAPRKGFHEHGDKLLRFEVEGEGETVKIGVIHLPIEKDGDWAMFVLKICEAQRVDPMHALVANFVMPIGALALMDGTLVVTQRLPVRGLDEGHVNEILAALIRERANVKEKLVRTPGAPQAHSHLAD